MRMRFSDGSLILAVAQERTCISNLPPFVNQETQQSPLLPVGIQALVPSYRFTCAANIVRWGVAINEGRGEHGIHLQVWRPVTEGGENQLLKLVGSNYFHIKPSVGEKLIYLVPGERWRIGVQSGDVIGFYLEDNPLITDDFQLQHQQDVTASMVLYEHAQDPYISISADTLSIRLLNTAPTITVQLGKLEMRPRCRGWIYFGAF